MGEIATLSCPATTLRGSPVSRRDSESYTPPFAGAPHGSEGPLRSSGRQRALLGLSFSRISEGFWPTTAQRLRGRTDRPWPLSLGKEVARELLSMSPERPGAR